MSRVLVTGSADGLGRAAAQSLLASGHEVVVHARNDDRGEARATPLEAGANLVVGDLADRDQVRELATSSNGTAPFDAVIHNAGVYGRSAVIPSTSSRPTC